MANYRGRIAEFEALLGKDTIDLKEFRKQCFGGCPHEKSIRPRCWKILLNYLPTDRSRWPSHLQKQRQVYKHFIDEMIVQPGFKKYESARTDVTYEDHPLNPNPESIWSQYFKDNEMLVQIDKDCRRLCPDLAFFQMATSYPCKELVDPEKGLDTLRKRVEHSWLKAQNVSKNRVGITYTDKVRRTRKPVEDYTVLADGEEAHWEVVERILFIYAKLNPGQGYVQGMNEILGPIYYTFSTDSDHDGQEFAEADAFWCFTNLMSEIRDNFIKSLDDSDCGIGMLMKRLQQTTKERDMTLWLRMEQQELRPQYYAFRWLTLLLSQEFALPDVLRVWDTLLSDVNRFDFLIYVCCAMLILIRDQILTGDFPTSMKLVQNYPASVDIHSILAKAVEIADR